MTTPLTLTLCLTALLGACAVQSAAPSAGSLEPRVERLERELRAVIEARADSGALVSVALVDLERGDSLLIDARTPVHAASTMKVPVMLQLFRLADAGALDIGGEIPVTNDFRSIADGSAYRLSPSVDSDGEIYAHVGARMPVRELIARMIDRSSNLATNILIERADAAAIARTMAELGASEMRVLRGVEDNVAFRAGMNNTTTAYGLMKVMESIARGTAASPAASAEMLQILEGQRYRELIPAGLPEGTRAANKTGWITGIEHDAAIVLPAGRAPYVLVVLTRGMTDRAATRAMVQEISARTYASLAGAR
jgi:beta-lactamase class A